MLYAVSESIFNQFGQFIYEIISQNNRENKSAPFDLKGKWSPADGGSTKITLQAKKNYYFVEADSIMWVEADAAVTNFHLTNGKCIKTNKILKHYRNWLQVFPQFFEISRSAMININLLKSLEIKDRKLLAIMDESTGIPVSAKHKKALLRVMSTVSKGNPITL